MRVDAFANMGCVRDIRWSLGMAMGRGGDGFCLPHPLLPYTYLLPYPYSMGMRN